MPFLQPGQYELPYQSGSDTSEAAARRAEDFVGKQGEIVKHWFQDQGAIGATQIEASAALGIGRPSMAARVHALENRGELVKTTARRDGAAVYRSAK